MREHIAKVLRDRRDKIGISVPKLAKESGLTSSTIYSAENGDHIKLSTLIVLCEALGLALTLRVLADDE